MDECPPDWRLRNSIPACDIRWRMQGYISRMKTEQENNTIHVQKMSDLMLSNYQELERVYTKYQELDRVYTEKDKRNDCSKFSFEDSDSIVTGYAEFDRITGGVNCGELIVLAGFPRKDISAIAMKVAIKAKIPFFKKPNYIHSPVECLFVSLKTRAEMCSMNALSVESGVNLNVLRSGSFSASEWRKLAAASGVLAESLVHIMSVSVMSLDKLLVGVKVFVQANEEVKLVVVDGFDQLNKHSDANKREEAFAEIIGELKNLAEQLNVALIITVPLVSRFLHPELEDLEAYSKSVYEGADTIAFLHVDCSTSRLLVAKHQGWLAVWVPGLIY